VTHYVLVVDDDYDLADALALFLRGLGFRVETASGGVEALERARREMPRLIISDIRMPNGNGIQLFRDLRALPGGGSVGFAFMSGFVSDRHDELAEIRKNDDAFRFFAKPLDMDSFQAFVTGFR
jgi:CheY-like chemotaxis protein